jgi:hypothetical protein|nr:MAG TPA: hypothetical protein [Caudoviricetes sp.]
MEKIIDLKSRDYNNYLKRWEKANGEESTTYLLKVEHPSLLVSTNEVGRHLSIEPRGGPVLRVGEALEGVGEVAYIDYVLGYGYVITFKE